MVKKYVCSHPNMPAAPPLCLRPNCHCPVLAACYCSAWFWLTLSIVNSCIFWGNWRVPNEVSCNYKWIKKCFLSCAVWTKRLLLCHRPQWLRAAPPQPPATSTTSSVVWTFFFFPPFALSVRWIRFFFFAQTEEFHEPVTLDFLDAELENDIKVEVSHDMCISHSRCFLNAHFPYHIYVSRSGRRWLMASKGLTPYLLWSNQKMRSFSWWWIALHDSPCEVSWLVFLT